LLNSYHDDLFKVVSYYRSGGLYNGPFRKWIYIHFSTFYRC